MVDSTAYERGPDSPSFSLVSGARASERTARSTPSASDGTEGAGAEHASALLEMGAVKQEAGAYLEAEDLFRRALEIGERALGPDNPALVPAMTSLASALISTGRFEAAEPLVHRALAASEQGLAQNDPDLAIVLNELARLCLKQSAHALAEPLLLRMFALKRTKGEDHPEVATVLASLATVRQALGRHESAEQLWRKVLEIRERTLAPNHFALATALENLGEACAARGKIGEALQLLQRAQTIRELTLGTGHQSVRVSRDRIADLQLQAEGFLDSALLEAPPPAPERYRLLSADAKSASPPPQARERTNSVPRKGTARVIESEPPTRTIERDFTTRPEIAPLAAPIAAPIAAAPAVAEVAAPKVQPAEPAAPVNYRDVILSIGQELEDDEAFPTATSRAAAFFASAVAAVQERQKATVIVVSAVALLVLLAGVSRGWSDSSVAGAAEGGSTPGGTSSTSLASVAATTAPAPLGDLENAPATAAADATPVATSSRARAAEQRTPAKKVAERSDRRVESGTISIPKLPTALATNFDSVVRARGGAGRAGETGPAQPLLESASGQRLTFEREDAANVPQRAHLIGSLPAPRYPAQLGNVQGEVQVRFQVDTMGRPVPSSISVVRSSDELFTAATLKVIPGMRFQPARSGGSEPKALNDVVQIGFQFRPAK